MDKPTRIFACVIRQFIPIYPLRIAFMHVHFGETFFPYTTEKIAYPTKITLWVTFHMLLTFGKYESLTYYGTLQCITPHTLSTIGMSWGLYVVCEFRSAPVYGIDPLSPAGGR